MGFLVLEAQAYVGEGLEFCMRRSKDRIGEGRERLSFVSNLSFPALDHPPSWTSPASAPAFSRTWISAQIAARFCLCPGLRMRSPVPAVASPSTCEVRGLYAATPAEGPAWKGQWLEDPNIDWIEEGDPEAGNQALLDLGRNLKGRI